jgi:hypothetical protein
MHVKNPVQPGDGDPRHGLPNTYRNHGCHCDRCTPAHSVAHREWENADPTRLLRKRDAMRIRRGQSKDRNSVS